MTDGRPTHAPVDTRPRFIREAADLVARASRFTVGGAPRSNDLDDREAVEAMTAHLVRTSSEEGRPLSQEQARTIAVGCARRA